MVFSKFQRRHFPQDLKVQIKTGKCSMNVLPCGREFAIFSLATFDIWFCRIFGHSRQLSVLRIIQAAWIPTFAQFMRCLSLRAGKLLNKVLPKCGCTTFHKMEHIVNVVLQFNLVAFLPWNMFIFMFSMHIKTHFFQIITQPSVPVLAQIYQVPKTQGNGLCTLFKGNFHGCYIWYLPRPSAAKLGRKVRVTSGSVAFLQTSKFSQNNNRST